MLTEVYTDATKVLVEYLQLENTPHGASQLYPEVEDAVYAEALPKGFSAASAAIVVGGNSEHPMKSGPITRALRLLRVYAGNDDPAAMARIANKCAYQINRGQGVTVASGRLISAHVESMSGVSWVPAGQRPFINISVSARVTA